MFGYRRLRMGIANPTRYLVLGVVAGLVCISTVVLAQPLLIEGGTVHTMVRDPFQGSVLIENGVIAAVGPNLEVPAGATRIDAKGLHVYPGIFDALSTLGLTEIGAVSATDDQAEMGLYNPHLNAATAIHPSSEVIPVTRSNGTTHALVAPQTDRDGVIAGQAALVNLYGWTVEEMVVDGSIGMVINWPGIVTRRFDFTTFSLKETPFNDAKEEAEKKQNELRDWVDAAKHYRQAQEWDKSRALTDQKLAAMAQCLDGKRSVIIQADAKRDIEAAMDFAEEYGLKMILAGGREAWKVTERLAAKDIPVILGRTQSLPAEEDDDYDRPFVNPSVLREAGIRIAFASSAGGGFGPGGPHSARTLPYEAAMAVAFGLSDEDAMRALTVWPAEMLRVDEKLGSIEAGKIANVIVTDGSPLEITSNVRHLIIGGREVQTDNLHQRLYERYRARPAPGTGAASRR